jgi:hypothetical protein
MSKKRVQASPLGRQCDTANWQRCGLVCSLVDRPDTFVAGAHIALIVCAYLVLAAAVAILFARPFRQA